MEKNGRIVILRFLAQQIFEGLNVAGSFKKYLAVKDVKLTNQPKILTQATKPKNSLTNMFFRVM